MKKCTKCGIEKEDSEFSKDNRAKNVLHSQCKECSKIYNKKNIENRHKKAKEYYKDNSEHIKEKSNEYNKNNIEHKKEYNKVNSEHIKEKQNKRHKERRKTDPLYKLICKTRNLIRQSLKRGGFEKTSKTAYYLGCTYEEFMIHIENKFQEGMTWDNYGEWEYDHIYPVSLAESEEHLLTLNHYTNFQPLWAEDNRRKGNKLTEELV